MRSWTGLAPANWPPEERVLLEAYAVGEVLNGDDPIDHVKVALVVNLPSEEVPWESQSDGADWLVRTFGLDKGGFANWWRSRQDPVWNHYIREPVRFWSVDGPDEDVLWALAERRFSDLPRVTATPDEMRAHTDAALAAALARLREVHANYWERDWRRQHRGDYRYPENVLWEAVEGYVDLMDTARSFEESD